MEQLQKEPGFKVSAVASKLGEMWKAEGLDKTPYEAVDELTGCVEE